MHACSWQYICHSPKHLDFCAAKVCYRHKSPLRIIIVWFALRRASTDLYGTERRYSSSLHHKLHQAREAARWSAEVCTSLCSSLEGSESHRFCCITISNSWPVHWEKQEKLGDRNEPSWHQRSTSSFTRIQCLLQVTKKRGGRGKDVATDHDNTFNS